MSDVPIALALMEAASFFVATIRLVFRRFCQQKRYSGQQEKLLKINICKQWR